MRVTNDKYELPLVVEDSCENLAKKCGIPAQSISKAIWSAKKRGGKCQYVKINENERKE